MIAEETLRRLKVRYLEAMVEAALMGHELGEWRSLGEKNLQYRASCRQCGQMIYVTSGLVYSELSPHCDAFPYSD